MLQSYFCVAGLLFLWCITVLYVVFVSYSKLPKTSFFARNVLIGLVRAGGCVAAEKFFARNVLIGLVEAGFMRGY